MGLVDLQQCVEWLKAANEVLSQTQNKLLLCAFQSGSTCPLDLPQCVECSIPVLGLKAVDEVFSHTRNKLLWVCTPVMTGPLDLQKCVGWLKAANEIFLHAQNKRLCVGVFQSRQALLATGNVWSLQCRSWDG